MDTPDDITIGVAFDIDYGRGDGGAKTMSRSMLELRRQHGCLYDDRLGAAGRRGFEYHLAGIGPNIATTLVHNSAVARQHTISSQTYNFSRRRLKR